MFKHLLIPLDGSRLAEAALPPAAWLAQTLGASATLIHFIERKAPDEVHGQRHLTNPEEAAAYLAEVAARAFPPAVRLERHVHTDEVGDVARSLFEHSDELRPDLIVMCAHGRSGLRGWAFGSIAQRVIALGSTPVLLIHPGKDAAPKPFACRRLLAPLDGSAEHEQGLCFAAGLAKPCGAAIHLLAVVPTPATLSGPQAASGQLLPGATAAVLDEAEDGMEDYLSHRVAQMGAQGLTLTSEVARGDPAKSIIRAAEEQDADVIVLSTHRKAGIDAFWAGSVAPRVARRTRIPLLLVPLSTD
jgi:nucleotide-binding universal stress UspA family protein